VTIAAAFLASLGFFDIYLVALLGWFGDIAGDMLFFSIGRFGLHMFKKKTTIDTSSEKSFIQKLDTLIHNNLILSLFIIKFTPYAPPVGITYIGQSNIPFRKYFIASFISCLPIPIIAAVVGFHIGYINTLLQKYTLIEVLPYIGIAIVVFIGIGVLFWYTKKRVRSVVGQDFRLVRSPDGKSGTSDA